VFIPAFDGVEGKKEKKKQEKEGGKKEWF